MFTAAYLLANWKALLIKVALVGLLVSGAFLYGVGKGAAQAEKAQLAAALESSQKSILEANKQAQRDTARQIAELKELADSKAYLSGIEKRLAASIEKNSRYHSKECTAEKTDIEAYNQAMRGRK